MSADNPLTFVDTNVLVYAYDLGAGEKQDRARSILAELWAKSTGCISIQVLQEFYVVITQKVPHTLTPELAAGIIRDLSYWRVHAPVAEDISGAVDLQQRSQTSFREAMILWSAIQLNCSLLWSEDLSTSQVHHGIRVINPFKEWKGSSPS